MRQLLELTGCGRRTAISWTTAGAIVVAMWGGHGEAAVQPRAGDSAGFETSTHLSDMASNPAREVVPSLFAAGEALPMESPTQLARPNSQEQPPYRPASLGSTAPPTRPASGAIPERQPNLTPIVEAVPPALWTNETVPEFRGLQDVVNPVTPPEADGPRRFSSGWRMKRVDELELAVFGDRVRPANAAERTLQGASAVDWPTDVGTVAWWVAPNLTYQPLIFEDARLERFGYASPYFAVQPIRSGFHFTNSAILAPFRAIGHRNQWESPLAFERPGSYAPPRREIFVPLLGH